MQDYEIDNVLSRASVAGWFVITAIWVSMSFMQTVPCLFFNWAVAATIGVLLFGASQETIKALLT